MLSSVVHEERGPHAAVGDFPARPHGAAAARLAPAGQPPSFYATYCSSLGDRRAGGSRGEANDAAFRDPDGESSDDGDSEPLRWAEAALNDAWDCQADFGVHSCRDGCWRRRAAVFRPRLGSRRPGRTCRIQGRSPRRPSDPCTGFWT